VNKRPVRRAFLPPAVLRAQWQVYWALVLGVAALVGVLALLGDRNLQRFTAGLPPWVALVLSVGAGGASLRALIARSEFAILRAGWRGFAAAAFAATVFGAIVIPADLIIVYPRDINVSLPTALAVYPVAGFFAEIAFHVLPLALMLSIAARLRPRLAPHFALGSAMLIAALLETTYQTQWMLEQERYGVGALGFNALHVFAINVVQLIIFKRHDFVSMYTFRLVYYFIWHIAWGTLRLIWLV